MIARDALTPLLPRRAAAWSRRWFEAATVVLAVLALAALTSGCSVPAIEDIGRAGNSETREHSQRVAAELEEELERLPGAVRAYVSYEDSIDLQAFAWATVTVAAGTDITATLDAVEQAIWLSDMDPLVDFNITVVDDQTPPAGGNREYHLDDLNQVEALNERWGERPE